MTETSGKFISPFIGESLQQLDEDESGAFVMPDMTLFNDSLDDIHRAKELGITAGEGRGTEKDESNGGLDDSLCFEEEETHPPATTGDGEGQERNVLAQSTLQDDSNGGGDPSNISPTGIQHSPKFSSGDRVSAKKNDERLEVAGVSEKSGNGKASRSSSKDTPLSEKTTSVSKVVPSFGKKGGSASSRQKPMPASKPSSRQNSTLGAAKAKENADHAMDGPNPPENKSEVTSPNKQVSFGQTNPINNAKNGATEPEESPTCKVTIHPKKPTFGAPKNKSTVKSKPATNEDNGESAKDNKENTPEKKVQKSTKAERDAKKQEREQQKKEREQKRAEKERLKEEKRLERERKQAEKEQKKMEKELKKIEREQKKAQKQASGEKQPQPKKKRQDKNTEGSVAQGSADSSDANEVTKKECSNAAEVSANPCTLEAKGVDGGESKDSSEQSEMQLCENSTSKRTSPQTELPPPNLGQCDGTSLPDKESTGPHTDAGNFNSKETTAEQMGSEPTTLSTGEPEGKESEVVAQGNASSSNEQSSQKLDVDAASNREGNPTDAGTPVKADTGDNIHDTATSPGALVNEASEKRGSKPNDSSHAREPSKAQCKNPSQKGSKKPQVKKAIQKRTAESTCEKTPKKLAAKPKAEPKAVTYTLLGTNAAKSGKKSKPPSVKSRKRKAIETASSGSESQVSDHDLGPPRSKRQKSAALNHSGPVWVQCGRPECSKWRQLKDCLDPSSVPEEWECSMNTDPAFNSCSVQEEEWSDLGDSQEYVESPFIPGSIVWARMGGYPWWPAMVEEDPDEETYYEMSGPHCNIPVQYHVVFFDTPVCRAWVSSSFIETFEANTDMNRHTGVNLPAKYKRGFKMGLKQAEKALSMTLKERLAQFTFSKRYRKTTASRKRAAKGKTDERVQSSHVTPKPGSRKSARVMATGGNLEIQNDALLIGVDNPGPRQARCVDHSAESLHESSEKAASNPSKGTDE